MPLVIDVLAVKTNLVSTTAPASCLLTGNECQLSVNTERNVKYGEYIFKN